MLHRVSFWRHNLSSFILVVLIVLLSVLAGLVTFTSEQGTTIFRHTAFWWVTAGVLVWGWVGARLAKQFWRGRRFGSIQDKAALALVVLAAVWVVTVHQPTGLKVVADEPIQMLTAKSLFESREAITTLRGHDLGLGFEATHGTVDKRPILYPWLVATTHSLTGYRVENAFYLNRFLGVALAVWLFVLGRRMAGNWGGVILAFLMMLPPMYAHNANSGGFEILNLLLMVALGHAFMLVLERPSDADRLGWLALTAALLAHCRYESVVFLLPAAIVVLVAWISARSVVAPWPVLVAPLLLVPRLWLQRVFERGDTWQLSSKPEALGEPFAFRFFYDNVGHALSYYFSGDFTSTNSIFLSAVGFLCVGFWVLLIYRRHSRTDAGPTAQGAYFLWLGLSAHLLLMMVYFWGQFDDLTTQRLALPTHLWLALPALAVPACAKSWPRFAPYYAALLASMLIFITAPQLRLNRFSVVNYATQTQDWMIEKSREFPAHQHRLVIDNFSGLVWLLMDTPVVTQEAARRLPERIRFHWKHGTFDEILVVQRLRYDAPNARWVPFPEDELGLDFDLEPRLFRRFNPTYAVRILRVTAIRSDHLDWVPGAAESEAVNKAVAAEQEYRLEWARQLP